MSRSRTKYAIVGTGGRSVMFIDALAGDFRETGEIVGFCDLSPTRMAWYNDRLRDSFELPPVPTFHATRFDEMIAQTRPDVVIVTTIDRTHHTYIVRAMELGCDVICEKPMTIDAPKAHAIFDAIERTGKSLRVTFNMRYIPHTTKVYELVRSGVIGTPTAVDVSWLLDVRHGADYFRRWHREKQHSGGLIVHKATHHFDLINWWIGSYPQTVFAMGALKFYGRDNAIARGEVERTRYARYTGEAAAEDDPFSLSLDADPTMRGLYLNAETDSGYLRDRNVFGDDITAEDTMALTVRYDSGVVMNYSLVSYSPWEGWNVAITGTKGRIEVSARYNTDFIGPRSDPGSDSELPENEWHRIKVLPMFGRPYEVPVAVAAGDHGGGDRIMLEQIFSPDARASDPFARAASHVDGAASILVGISANESIKTGLPVRCSDLISLQRT